MTFRRARAHVGAPTLPLRFAAAVSLVALVALRAGGAAAGDAPSVNAPPAVTAPAGTASTAIIDPVVVTATRTPEPLSDVPAAVSVVEQAAIQPARPTISLHESMPRVPGVFVQHSGNFAQDARIQIRGFGTRAAFGIREIKVLVDGIPETLPDGGTELDAVDPGAIERIEVLRGPAAALYGNASGGVIHVFTEEPPDTPQAEITTTAGAYGFRKVQAQAGVRGGGAGVFLHTSAFEIDGYREHSRARSRTLNGKLVFGGAERGEAKVLMSLVSAPTADDAGGLGRADTRSDPEGAAPLNSSQKAGEDVGQEKIGVTARKRIGPGEVSGYAYWLHRDFSNRLPIPPDTPPLQGGIVLLERTSPGIGAQYTFVDARLLGASHRLTVGVDTQHQDDDRRRYANLGGERGALGLVQRERVTSVGPYVRDAIALRDDLELSLGVRWDHVRFEADVDFPAESPDGGSRTFEEWSPAAGLRWTVRDWLAAHAAVGTAFQVPATTELANPAGAGFNPDVDPQRATSYEVGVRGDFARVDGEVVAFLIDVRDELVPFELSSQGGRTFFRNAGRSRRYGVELSWQARPVQRLQWTSSLTAMQSRYRDYDTDAGDLDGNEEPGIPDWWVFQELAWRHPRGAFAAVEALVADAFFVDDANSARAREQASLNARAGWGFTAGAFSFEPFVGIENVLDDDYDARVRLNAQNLRYFEPASGSAVYGGLTISAHL